MKKILILLLGVLCLSGNMSAQETFKNPVIPGEFADPTVIRVGDTYYAAGTSSEWAPFYPMYASSDLVNWTQTGYVFDKQPEWTLSSFWAPELFYYRDKVYIYYTARNKKGVSYIGVATADHPTGPYTDHGLIVEYGTEAIDAFILEDNGELYISWKAYGLDNRPIELLGCKLSDDGLKMDGEPFSLMRDDERIGMEGQHWFKYNDYYYMIYSVKDCCGPKSDYQVYAARSKDLKGPYERYSGNPILYAGDSDFISCGHGTVTTTPDGRMFYLCHAYLGGDRVYGGRQGILQEMIINKEGWPEFTTGNIARILQPSPFKGVVQEPVGDFRDDFKSEKLSVSWSWNYAYSDIRVKTGKELLLSGVSHDDNQYGTTLCLRPSFPDYTYETRVINQNQSFKGLTMYGDSKNLFLWGCEGDRIVLKAVRDGKETILNEMKLSSSSIYLKIEVKQGVYCSFLWSVDGKVWKKNEAVPASNDYSYLVRWDRVARPGLIHVGEEKEPAAFSYFHLINK